VQVALEPAALAVAGLHDPCARRSQLGEARQQFGVQPLILERERGGANDGAQQPGVLEQHRVMDERGDEPALVNDLGHGVIADLDRQRDGADPLVTLGQPVGEADRLSMIVFMRSLAWGGDRR
jgi:hypothetical protein